MSNTENIDIEKKSNIFTEKHKEQDELKNFELEQKRKMKSFKRTKRNYIKELEKNLDNEDVQDVQDVEDVEDLSLIPLSEMVHKILKLERQFNESLEEYNTRIKVFNYLKTDDYNTRVLYGKLVISKLKFNTVYKDEVDKKIKNIIKEINI